MNTNLYCPQLILGVVGATASGGIRIQSSVTVSAGVTCEAGTSGAYCCRSGDVSFSWVGLSTTSPPPSSIGSNYATYTDPVTNKTTIVICPGEVGASASILWNPTVAVVGPVSTGSPAVGYIKAGIACDASICNGQCAATQPGDYPGSTACSPHIDVLPAKASAQYVEAMALLKKESQPGVTLIGFGFGNFERPSKLRVVALETQGFDGFTVPNVMLSLVEPRNVHPDLGYHSGVLVRGIHFAQDVRLTSSRELVVDGRRQAVLEVQWSEGSMGKRAIIEVTEEIDGRRVGGFVLGLRNVPIGYDGLVWL